MARDTRSDSMKSSKKQPEPKKVLDISRPKRRPTTASTTAPQLVIPKRSVMVTVADSPSTSSEPVASASDVEPTPTVPAAPKRVAKVITPSTAPEVSSTVDAEPAATQEPETPKAADPMPVKKTSETPAPTPKATQPAPEKEVPETASDAPEPHTAPESNEEPEEDVIPDSKAPEGDVKKALEDAKREEEIRGYIDKHEFFVPINSVARKRNIKVTLVLISLELLLGLFLLNLMLDAGLIYLLQKIPHTHFFDLQ